MALLVQAGLKHRAGIKTLIQQYKQAAEKLYKPKGYTNKDIMRSIVLLRLGGAHVAKFAHQCLALPSLTMIRHQTILPALLVSPSAPTVAEVEANIISCYSSLASYSGKDSEGSSHNCTRDPQPSFIKFLCWMSLLSKSMSGGMTCTTNYKELVASTITGYHWNLSQRRSLAFSVRPLRMTRCILQQRCVFHTLCNFHI